MLQMRWFSILLSIAFAFRPCASDADLHYANATSPGNEGHKGVNSACSSGFVMSPNNGKCFIYVRSPMSWEAAEAHCNRYGSHLAALASYQEIGFAKNLCSEDIVKGCWVGGRGVEVSSGFGWKWSDDSSLWNASKFPVAPFNSDCHIGACQFSDDSCTLVTNGSISLVADRCNTSRAFVCTLNVVNKCFGMRCHSEYVIILGVVSGLILSTSLAVVVWLLVYKRSKRNRRGRKLSNQEQEASALAPPSWKVFTKEELRSITKNFSEGNRLPGDSKTGGTYCGLLPDGSKVAIKRLKRSSYQRKKEFYSEIGRLARLHHPNLVSVKGCCYDHGSRHVVYEFIVNGPLDRWLYHTPRGGSLNWAMRMKIATTLAQGIAFLHDKAKPHAVHRDICASNVLLDEEFGAHLMGVGLSKFVPWEVMHERTVIAGGTYGYLAPEFVYSNELTTKSDVYSFGVLLLEIVSGRKPAQPVDSVGLQNLQSIFEWATPLVQSHCYMELLDPQISTSPSSSACIPEAGVIQRVVDLVYACTQHVPSVRPRMSHVVHQLQQLSQQPTAN